MTNMLAKKEEIRWSFLKKGKQVYNVCTRMLLLFGFAAGLMTATEARANPTGGTVVGGSATITNTPAELQINQSSQNAIINWNSFDIAAGETTHFYQPNASATALNRVFNSAQLSTINGNLVANGHVFVINPNGVLIGKGAHVDTAGFIASTADIANDAFMNSAGKGPLNFNIPGNPHASIVNQGTITVADTGLAVLVGPTVRNDGVIEGNLSKIQLGAADTFGVDLYGDGLISLAVSSGTEKRTLTAENNGSIIAQGGKVLMTAAAASDVVDSVINTSGVIQASSLENHNGEIVLKADGAKTTVAGTLDATGGLVETSGDYVNVADTTVIKASDWVIDPLSIKIYNFILDPGEFDITYSNVSAGLIDLTLSAGTNVTISTTGSAAFYQNNHGDIIVADDLAKFGGGNATLTLNATRNISFKNGADIYSTHNKLNVALNAGGSITNNANNTVTTNGGTYAAKAGTSVTLAGDVSTGAGSLTILGSNGGSAGDVSTAGLNSTSGAISVSTDQGTVTLNNGATSTSGDITVSSSGLLTANTVTTGGAGKVVLTSTGNAVNAAAITAAGGNIAVSAGTAVTVTGAITDAGAGTITVTGAGNVSLAGLSSGSGAIDAETTNGSVTLNNGATSTSGNITAKASGAVLASANITTGGAGAVSVTSTGDNVTTQSISTGAGSVTIKAGKTVLTQNINTTNGGIKISNGGVNNITTGDLSIISADGAAGVLDVDSNGNLTTGNITVTDNNVTGTANEAAFLTSGSSGAASTLTVHGDVKITSTDGNTTSLNMNAKQGALTVDGDVVVSNDDGGDPALHSTATATLKAKGDVTVNGANGIAVSANDANQPNVGTTVQLSVTSTAGGINIAHNVTTSSTENKTTPSSSGDDQVATASLSLLALNDITVGGTVTGTATSTNTGAASGIQERSSSTVSVVSTAGDLWLGDQTVNSIATHVNDNHTYDGTAYNYPTATAQTADGGANSATTILSGANHLYSLNITADDASKVYGQTATFAPTAFTNSPLTHGGTVTGVTETSTGAPATAHVGAYDIVASNATGTYLYNYNITYTNGTLSVTPASLTITADAKTKVYGTNDPTLTSTATGLVNGDTFTLTRAGYGTVPGENVGTYAITLGTFANSGDYTISYTGANLKITKASLSITADNKSKTYGTNDPALTYSQTGLVNGVTVDGVTLNDTISGSLSRDFYGTLFGEQAGNYTIRKGSVAVSDPGNYHTTFHNGTLKINKASLSITADDKSKVYGTNDPGLTYSQTGLVNGVTVDGVTINDIIVGIMFRQQYGTLAGEQVGSYTISGFGGPVDFWNYNTTLHTGTLTITPAALTITADDLSKTYGDNDPTLTYGQTGLVDHLVDGVLIHDTIASATSGSLTRDDYGTVAGEQVGDHNIVQGTVTASSNYALTFVGGTETITPRNLTISAVTDTKQYDGTTSSVGTPVAFGLVNGIVDGVNLNDTITGTQVFASPNVLGPNGSTLLVNSYVIHDGNGGSNYNVIAVDTAAGTITPAPLTLTADSFSKPFGTTLTFNGTEFTTSGTLYGSDSITGVTLSSLGAPAPAPIGHYAIDASNATGTGVSNYDITYVPGDLNVREANLGPVFQVDPLGRPILSVGDLVLNYSQYFESRETQTLDVDISMRGDQTASNEGGANALANIEPAAGGDDDATHKKHKKKQHHTASNNPSDLANIEPAAGGNGGGAPARGNFACANDFLDGKNCTAQ